MYCKGDPVLDVGNFLGHITEQSIRTFGDHKTLADRVQAMEDRFVELVDRDARVAVQAYATLTLVRHVYLSTLFDDRRHTTEKIIDLCEERLSRFGRSFFSNSTSTHQVDQAPLVR